MMRRAPRNFAVSLAASVGVMLLSLISSRIVVHRLNAEQFGAWVVLSSFLTYSTLLDLGIAKALERAIAADRGRRPGRHRLQHLGAALRAYTLLGLLAATIVIVGGLAYSGRFGLDIRPGSELFWADLVLAVGAFVALPSSIFTAVLAAHERYDLVDGCGVLIVFLTTSITIAVFLVRGSVLALALAAVGVIVLAAAIRCWMAFRIEPELLAGLRRPASGAELWRLATASGGFFVQTAGAVLVWRLDPLIVGAGVSIAAVTSYALAQRLAFALQDLGTVALRTLLPSLARADAGGGRDQVRRAVGLLTRSTVLVVLPLTALMMLESGLLLRVWVGPQFERSGGLVAVLLLAATGAVLLRNPGLVALQAVSSSRRLALLAGGEGIANVGLSLALVFWLRELGVAIATLLPAIAFGVFGYLAVCRREFGLGVSELFGPGAIRCLLATGLASTGFLLPIPGPPTAVGLAHGLAFLVVYCGLTFLITPAADRSAARRLVLQAWRTAATGEGGLARPPGAAA
jgi:O-antigen/teichoic acid export membrane protein